MNQDSNNYNNNLNMQNNNLNSSQSVNNENFNQQSVQQNIRPNQSNFQSNQKNSIAIILGVILGTIMLIFIIIFGLKSKILDNDEKIYGEWDCGTNIKIIIKNDKTFEMYDSSNKDNMNVIGNFTIDDKQQESTILKYVITLKTNNRTLYGNKLTDDYTTQYAISIDKNDEKHFAMINTISNSLYSCEKIN